MPRSIEAVLAARIDRLTLEQKQVLQSAAVIGKEVPLSILRAIIDLPEDQLYKALDRLQLVELLTERIAFPDSEYIFTHALTHSVANGMLLRSHRRALHARIVDALEAQGIDSAPDHVERLAQHAFEAELWDKAAGYSRRAAANAAQTAAYAASVASLERALLALEQLPHTPEIMRDMIDVRLQLRSSLMPLGRMQETRQYLLGAQSLAEQLSDRERLARVYSYLCQYFTVTFDARAAIEWGERAVELASEAGNLGLQVSSSFLLAETLYSLGEFKRSAALLGQNIQLLEGASTLERFGMTGFPASLSRGLLARCLAELGEFDEAAHWQGDAIRIAREVNQPFTQATVLSSDGFVYVMKGELAPAIVALTEAVEICRTWDLHIPLPPALARLGYARLLSGDNRGGLELLEQAASLAEGLPVLENAAILVWLSSAYKLSGRVDQARLTARRAFELADRSQQRGKRAHSLRSLGGSYAAGTTDELLNAETSYHEALELAIELGMQPLEAHCHFGLGQLYRRLDQPERSDAEFALARELYLKLGMTFWLRHSD
jgi:predicted ATPase